MDFVLRGYQKKIVCLKRTGSPIIEEAYFVLSDGTCLENGRERFLKEANRIIEENTAEKKRNKDRRILHFCLGAVTALAVCVGFMILRGIFS